MKMEMVPNQSMYLAHPAANILGDNDNPVLMSLTNEHRGDVQHRGPNKREGEARGQLAVEIHINVTLKPSPPGSLQLILSLNRRLHPRPALPCRRPSRHESAAAPSACIPTLGAGASLHRDVGHAR